jgi:error-prone DNA polymerase
VRVGLSRVFGLSEATGARIVAERARRPFGSLADVLARARPTLPEAESLVLAGAFDWSGRSRPSLLLEARVTLAPVGVAAGARAGRRARDAGAIAVLEGAEGELMPEAVSPLAVPALPEFDGRERVRGECAATGLWFSGHPLEVFVAAGASAGAVAAAALPDRVGTRVRIVGLPCASRRVETKQGASMLFVTLGDRSGLAECVLFPDAYRANAAAVRGQVVCAEGRVEDTLGAVTLTLERAVALA